MRDQFFSFDNRLNNTRTSGPDFVSNLARLFYRKGVAENLPQ
jgi:hypothetical protein